MNANAMRSLRIVLPVFLLGLAADHCRSADVPNLNEIPTDLVVPEVVKDAPSAGHRVQAVTAGWESTSVHHTLYLPRDWKPEAKLPVIVEYAGNGGFRNALGDVSEGTVEGCMLGYGLSGGAGYIWVCLPFVEITTDGKKQNKANWWGDVAETKRYCIATVRDICARYGGDAARVVLCGFSRGAIACNYIGLHDDEIARLWCAFFCHSHYDGVRKWPYADADEASALKRLERLHGRPQWISHEGGTDATREYIERSGIKAPYTFATLPYPNHSAAWVLRDLPLRKEARAWLEGVKQTGARRN